MKTVNTWIMSIRPKTLSASIGPVVLGLSLSYFYRDSLDLGIAFLTILCALFMQITANQVNDYYDYLKGIDDESRLGPPRMVASGKISVEKIKLSYYLSTFFAALIGVVLVIKGGVLILIIGVISLLFAYAYSAGPFPFSNYAMGELLAFIFFGPVVVWGTFYLQVKDYSFSLPIIMGFGVGAVASIIMSINNLRDRVSDKKTGKKTLANQMSEKMARTVPILFLIISLAIPILVSIMLKKYLILIVLFAAIPFIGTWVEIVNSPIDKKMNQLLANAGNYMLLYVCLFSAGLLL